MNLIDNELFVISQLFCNGLIYAKKMLVGSCKHKYSFLLVLEGEDLCQYIQKPCYIISVNMVSERNFKE